MEIEKVRLELNSKLSHLLMANGIKPTKQKYMKRRSLWSFLEVHFSENELHFDHMKEFDSAFGRSLLLLNGIIGLIVTVEVITCLWARLPSWELLDDLSN